MTNYEFACWVRGYLQLCPDVPLTTKRLYILKNHLNLVCAVSGSLGEKNQSVLDRILEIQQSSPAPETYTEFKQFLHDIYFEMA